MSVLSDQSIFATMKQDGPFAVEESVSLDRSFSRRHREWVRRLMADQVQTTKYRAVRSQIFNLLQVQDYAAIQRLLSDECGIPGTVYLFCGARFHTLPARQIVIVENKHNQLTRTPAIQSGIDESIEGV